MTAFFWCAAGVFLGGTVTTILFCCLSLHRTNQYEAEIRKLRRQLNTNH